MSRLVLSQITIKKERSISSTTWYYLLQPSNASAPDSTNYGNPPPTYSDTGYSGWSTTEPTYTVGDDRVLYIMVQTLYSDSTFSYSTPSISSSYEAAKDAYDEIIQAESVIEQFEELGLKKGYIWDNATYIPASGSIPVYPVGTYIASGILVNGERSITHANSNTYGLNTWISTGGINLRYNAIDLMKLTTSNLEFYYPSTSSQNAKKAISLGTNGAINSLVFYGFNNSNKTMELTNNALNFYNPADGSTLLSSLTSNGLILSKGGIVAGTAGQNGYIYLSTEDYQLKDATNSGLTINGHTPTTQGIDGRIANDPAWRQVIGTKFGVDSEGNLYASNANIEGDIVASSLTISSNGNSYNAWDAINVTGYSIEIETIEITGSTTTKKLIPHLYHNGANADIEVTDWTKFIWYRDAESTGITGSSTDGSITGYYGSTYKVTYRFEDGAVSGGTEITTITVQPTDYITDINNSGIKIHPKNHTTGNYIQLDGTGMEVFEIGQTDVSIASFGANGARIGAENTLNVITTSNGIKVRDGLTELATFGANGITLGKAGEQRIHQSASGLAFVNEDNYYVVNMYTESPSQYDHELVIYNATTTNQIVVGKTISLTQDGRDGLIVDGANVYLTLAIDEDLYTAIDTLGWTSDVIV